MESTDLGGKTTASPCGRERPYGISCAVTLSTAELDWNEVGLGFFDTIGIFDACRAGIPRSGTCLLSRLRIPVRKDDHDQGLED
jgi:hypothetical protein